MVNVNHKIGWTINKEYGYISEMEWTERDDKHIEIQHFKSLRGVRCAPEIISTEHYDEEPYENNDAWVFTNEFSMYEWIRNESHTISSKLQHYLERLSVVDSRANFMINAVWPKNFVIGHTPSGSRSHTRVYISRRKVSEYSVESVIACAEKQLGMPLNGFSRVWLKCEYGRYCNEVDVTLAVESSEQVAYFNKYSAQESEIRNAVEGIMQLKCPSLKYNLDVYRTPKYLFGDDKYLVNAGAEDFYNTFFTVLGNNLKTKLSSAMRHKSAPKTAFCGYLISNNILDKIPAHIISCSIPLPYAWVTNTCYAIHAPINIKVWARPDSSMVVDTHIPVGSATRVQLDNEFSSQNILDHLFKMLA